MYTFVGCFLFIFYGFICLQAQPLAVIRYPVVDMIQDTILLDKIAASPDSNLQNCLREYQGLFNEIVTILKYKDNFVNVAFDRLQSRFFGRPNSFWVHRDSLISLDSLSHQAQDLLPCRQYAGSDIMVLTYPFKQFSVGTRFVHLAKHDIPTAYAISWYDFTQNKVMIDYVNHTDAIKEVKKSKKQGRKLFVELINQLVNRVEKDTPGNVVAYVWGGASFTRAYPVDDFYKNKTGGWDRFHYTDIYTGYDCSAFVFRMAKIAGIDFPYKNSKIIKASLKPLNRMARLQDGDIIWIDGHIMIIGDYCNNQIIEARSYQSGYGCLHRASVQDMFIGIASCGDLVTNYYANKPLILKNKQGEFYKQFDEFLLLKLV